MKTREEILDELINDLKGSRSSEELSRAYLVQIHRTLLDIRDLLANKE